MAFSWYIERRGKQFGPYTGTKLKELAASGRLKRTDLVRRDDQPTWMAAAKIKGLFTVGDTASPPPLSTANVVGTSPVGSDTSPAPKTPPESTDPGRPTDDSATKPPETRFTRIDSHLRGMVETTKAAARLAAAHACKVHLANVTLPAAYLELGRDIFASGRFREEFLDLFSRITASQERRQRMGQVRVDGERQRSLSEKATDASTRVKVTAQAKLVALKEESLLRQLGESSYERHGEHSGPDDSVRPVSDCRSSLEGLEREIDHLCKIGNGRIVTPRRVLVGGLGFCVVMVALMASKPGAKDGPERKVLGSRVTIQVDEPKQSTRVEVVRSGGRAEVAQTNDRSEVVRSDGQALERPRATIKHDPYTLVMMPPISPTRVHRVPNGSESSPLVEAKGVANLLGHEGAIGAVAINGAGTIAASGDESGVVKLWDLNARKEAASFKVSEAKRPVKALAFSPSGDILLTACGTNQLWRTDAPRLLRTLKGGEGWITDAAFSPDGRTIAAVMLTNFGYESSIQLWDAETGRDAGVLRGDSGTPLCLAFSPDGKMLACGVREGKLHLWDWKGRKVVRTLNAHEEAVSDITYSPDGKLMASAGGDNSCKVWDVGSGRLVRAIKHGGGVILTAFLPNDGGLATVERNSGAMHVWETATGREKTALKIYAGLLSSQAHVATDGKVVVAGDVADRNLVQATEVDSAPAEAKRRPVAVEDLAQVDFSCGPNGEPVELERSVTSNGFVVFERHYYRDRSGKKVSHGPYISYRREGIKRDETVYVHGIGKFTQIWDGGSPVRNETYRGDGDHTRIEFDYWPNGGMKSIGRYRVLHEVTETGESIRSIPHGLCLTFYDNTVVEAKGLVDHIAGVHQEESYEDGRQVSIAIYNRSGVLLKSSGKLGRPLPR